MRNSQGQHFSFERKLWLAAIAIAFSMAVLGTSVIAPSFIAYNRAQHNLIDMEAFRQVLDAANRLSAERGPANVLMSIEPASDADVSRRLNEFRAASDEALASLLDQSDAAPVSEGRHATTEDLVRATMERLRRARVEVDRVAAQSPDRRQVKDIQRAIGAMIDVVDTFQAVIAWDVNVLIQTDPGLATWVTTAHMISDLREYGGRTASEIMGPVAAHHPLTLDELTDSSRTRGRLAEIWRLLGGQRALYAQNQQMNDVVKEVEKTFFGDGLAIIDRVTGEGRVSGKYSLAADELTYQFVKTLRPLEEFRTKFLDEAMQTFTHKRDAALEQLTIACLSVTAALVVLAGLLRLIHASVLVPLFSLREDIISLAEVRDPGSKPLRTRVREMQRVCDALQFLRERLRERDTLMSELREQAEKDELTGLWNRRSFERFGQVLVAQNKAGPPSCLILLDIDHFKSVNDTHGHLAGDEVLRQVAALLRSSVRSSDIAARFGGEEFAVLIPDGNLGAAAGLANALRTTIEEHPVRLSGQGTRLRISASFGVASVGPGSTCWPHLIQSADIALYQAKSQGRNRVCVSGRPLLQEDGRELDVVGAHVSHGRTAKNSP